MTTAAEDRAVLAAAKTWRATPGNYASLRSLWLKGDGSGELVYGYGQTIFARVNCRWEVPAPGRLRLTYLDSPPFQRFRGYAAAPDASARELGYTLTPGRVAGVEDAVANPYEFDHTLELSEPPWPPELELPYDVPRVFYGRAVPPDAPGAGPDASSPSP